MFKNIIILIILILSFNTYGEGYKSIHSVASCDHQNYDINLLKANTIEIYQDYELTFVYPPNAQGPVLVDLGLFIIEITEINEVTNTFRVAGYIDLVWCDPRLAFASTKENDEKILLEEDAALKLEKIWWPDISFANEESPRKIENQILVIRKDGTIDYQEKFAATLEANYNLLSFPFDKQLLEIEIESFTWTGDFLNFHENEDILGFAENFKIPEWNIANVISLISIKQEIRDRAPFSEFLTYIEVERKPGFYVFKILIPLLLIITSSWSIFWIPMQELANRIHISLAVILSAVAYQFVISGSLPKIPEFTVMDSILIISFEFIVISVIESVAVYQLYRHQRFGFANFLDMVSRIMIPATYLSIILIIILIH